MPTSALLKGGACIPRHHQKRAGTSCRVAEIPAHAQGGTGAEGLGRSGADAPAHPRACAARAKATLFHVKRRWMGVFHVKRAVSVRAHHRPEQRRSAGARRDARGRSGERVARGSRRMQRAPDGSGRSVGRAAWGTRRSRAVAGGDSPRAHRQFRQRARTGSTRGSVEHGMPGRLPERAPPCGGTFPGGPPMQGPTSPVWAGHDRGMSGLRGTLADPVPGRSGTPLRRGGCRPRRLNWNTLFFAVRMGECFT
ncbi:hypothetical protein HD594_000617 [Microbacterium thalassium]|uniref:Uncharacterized protein n=1 Tax=Microbacterium thalassium TaxID=362649 RepID=A0A7X0KTP6_9MICO|nr:hypothetical protein [Microbacterium thalassium]